MKYIQLGGHRFKNRQIQFAIVDDDDFEELNKYRWCLRKSNGGIYANRNFVKNGKQVTLLMHRLILNAPKGLQVDHRNHNTLDNRKENIRLATASQNQHNTRVRKDNISGFKGVSWNKQEKKWRVQIQCIGKNHYLGSFLDKNEAINVHNKASKKLHGEFNYTDAKNISLYKIQD